MVNRRSMLLATVAGVAAAALPSAASAQPPSQREDLAELMRLIAEMPADARSCLLSYARFLERQQTAAVIGG